jgi:hypothetical protein
MHAVVCGNPGALAQLLELWRARGAVRAAPPPPPPL